MQVHLSSFASVLGVVAAGALFTVLGTSWLRSRALASVENAPDSRARPDWVYIAALWAMSLLLSFAYYAVGLMSLRLSIPLTGASTLGILGLIWPPYLRESRFTAVQQLVQRIVVIVISAILISLAAGHYS